jgi:prepilin-type N-terminal cleavage/methylation domain-containing protein
MQKFLTYISTLKMFRAFERLRSKRGFTLIEILVVIGMLAILSTIVLIAVNPLRQFAQARNTERQNDVAVLLNAISERIADHGGQFWTSADTTGCGADLPSTQTEIGNKSTDYDVRPCLVSAYLAELPKDPTTGINTCTTAACANSGESYDLGYMVSEDPDTRRVTVCAPGAAETALPESTSFCLTR